MLGQSALSCKMASDENGKARCGMYCKIGEGIYARAIKCACDECPSVPSSGTDFGTGIKTGAGNGKA